MTDKPMLKPYQFTIRGLLLLPLGIVVIGTAWKVFGPWGAVLGGVGCVVGLVCYKVTGRLKDAVLLFGLYVLLLALWAPDFRSHNVPSRSQCCNDLKQIGIALFNYHDVHGCFPPAVITDEAGRPLLGWRTLILPFLDHKPAYDRIDLSLPWGAPENHYIASQALSAYVCPSKPTGWGRPTETAYVAIVGKNTPWPPNGCRTFEDFSDAMSETIMVVEVADSGIDWIEPRDLTVDKLLVAINSTADKSISSYHKGGANVLFADGSVRFLPDDLLEETLRAMLTLDGGEMIEEDAF